ncbi:TPA: hypothetical protein N0F65_005879 [Lagenidium giganteum]|uniref:non-specific serine/threonine protein kinase n=1 Tax=Lagenidium giganteum TaxID=4803 RepID=A0AAV2YQG4_9STRA|nr:TPA: hypothetical protein N0F65_005879 [Lagenidium giganteum]
MQLQRPHATAPGGPAADAAAVPRAIVTEWETPPTLQRSRHHQLHFSGGAATTTPSHHGVAATATTIATSATASSPTIRSAREHHQRHHDDNIAPVRAYGSRASSVSARHVNLHAYDATARHGIAELKIGGHRLDHRRLFPADGAVVVHGPTKTFSNAHTLGGWTWSSRASTAYQHQHRETLEYACVKIGGHPLDHVPFINRGQPSRPLLGFSAEPPLLPPPQVIFSAAGPAHMQRAAPAVVLGRNIAGLYDCSRCLRMRSTPRLQLCCGHPICASCVSSRSLPALELDGHCLVDCVRCGGVQAVGAIVFKDRVIRVATSNDYSAVATAATATKKEAAAGGRHGRLMGYGGVVAAISFGAGRLAWRKPSTSPVDEGADDALEAIMGDPSDLAKVGADVATTGAARWQKRVNGLKAPSKLLKYEFVDTLGVGNFAEVMLVKQRNGRLTVLKESDKLPEAVNEIQILSRIQSPHVVRIYRYFVEEIGHRHFAYIEMEYCDRGDLAQLIKQGPVDTAKFDHVFRQLCLGLQEIHDRGIVHRDLKPGNILLTSEGIAKIADFGVSTVLESNLLTHHAAGTLAFMAPEVRRYFLGEDVSYDSKADVWSLGALGAAMLVGTAEPRVATRPLDEVLESMTEKGVPTKYVKLLGSMLDADPSKRPTLTELVPQFPAMNARL